MFSLLKISTIFASRTPVTASDDKKRSRLIKERNPYLFRVKHNIQFRGFTFEALGNDQLLCLPRRVFVQCSRSLTEADIEKLKNKVIRDYPEDTVFISPSISQGEKAVMRTAYERRCPVVLLQENGFGQYAKPAGRAFDACAEGRMLMLSP